MALDLPETALDFVLKLDGLFYGFSVWLSMSKWHFRGDVVMRFVKEGVTFGSALAMVISFSTHESILWAILHGIFSWLYVIYFAIVR